MNTIKHLAACTAAVILAGLTALLLALSTGVSAAFAYVMPPGPSSRGTMGTHPAPTIAVGGMPGWQTTLIAAAAAVLAATAAVLLDRARAARRRAAANPA